MTSGFQFRAFFLKLREKLKFWNRGPNFPPPRWDPPIDDLQVPKEPPMPPPGPPQGP